MRDFNDRDRMVVIFTTTNAFRALFITGICEFLHKTVDLIAPPSSYPCKGVNVCYDSWFLELSVEG
jgi:hypothetical protein